MENINTRIEEIKKLLASREDELKLAEKAKATDSTMVWRRDLINSIRDLKDELSKLENELEETKKAEEEARRKAEEARKNEASKTAYFHKDNDEDFGLDPEEVKKEEERMKKEAEERAKAEEAKKAEEEAKRKAEEARKRDASKTGYFHDQKSDEYFGLDPEEVRKEEERMKKEAEERAKREAEEQAKAEEEARRKAEEEARKNEASQTGYFHDQKSDEYFGLDPEEVRKEEERMKKEAEETANKAEKETNDSVEENKELSKEEKERITFIVQQIKVLFLNMNITTDELLIALKAILEQAEKRKEDLTKGQEEKEEISEGEEKNETSEGEEKHETEETEVKLTEQEIKNKILEIEQKQRALADKAFNKLYDLKQEKLFEEESKKLEEKQLEDARKESVKEFESYRRIDKFILRFRENRTEAGIIKSFFRAFRRDEKIDARIYKDIQAEILEENKPQRQKEEENLKNEINSKILSEFNNTREEFLKYGLGERQSALQKQIVNRFPEYKEEIQSLSEEMKKYEKEIAEFDKEAKDGKNQEKDFKEPKDAKTTEEKEVPEGPEV